MFCRKCGEEIPDNSTVCGYCGTPTDPNSSYFYGGTPQNMDGGANGMAIASMVLGIISVLFIKKKNLLLSSTMDNNLYFWMLSTFQCISIMTDIFCCKKNSMCLIDDDKVIIGRKNAVSIVNITKCNRQDKAA